MNYTRLWTAATIIALIVVVGFVLSVPHTNEVSRQPELEKTAVPRVPTITLHDVFKKGVHTITGSITTPNACTTVIANATVVGSATSTQKILLAISAPVDTGICLQEPTRIKFSATANASAGALIQATVNGVTASTTSS